MQWSRSHLPNLRVLWLGGALVTAQAAELEADKSGYTLAHPTPEKLLREMATDRPDATESPFTVDAGHAHVATCNVGLTGKLGAHTQLDAGANFGVSRAADDVGLFAGVSRRF